MSPAHEPTDPTAAQPDGSAAGSIPAQAAGPGELAGQSIGRYKLLEKLGEGGMGSVWMAQQSEPVKRRVALKIIKLGMDTREVVARFEVERQALALMDHPHIAKVLDAGATGSGRPYFVMELVRGVPITTYCDQAKLDLRERLELFCRVCHAIQHAHHKGIIHRDVKPSNVLVALQDGVPQPKVIDFGIAKATSAELTHQTLYTKLSQVIGTPEYMAPEQAESGGLDIDTRADIYSLGVLLYELLTGTKPFDIKQAAATGFEELLRVIREDDPAKPSTRISSLGEGVNSIAYKRGVDTQVLNRRLRGDLDWIVMKALEKDRSRRYETANGFAEDIANYLNDEPVSAAPPSARYRLGKLLRRRKKTVLSVALIALLLIAGSVGTGIGWWRTSQANKSLDAALSEKAQALHQEEEQRLLAEGNAERARSAETRARKEAARASQAEAATQARADELEQVAAFQAEQLAGLDVEQMGVRLRAALLEAAPQAQRPALVQSLVGVNFTSLSLDTLRANLFERTVEAIDEQFAPQPLVQAQLLQTTADTWSDLGLLEIALDPQERALSIRRKALGDEHQDTLDSINNLGVLLQSQGKPTQAEPLIREALAGFRRVLGEEHLSTLSSISNLGSLLQSQGNFDEAEPLKREVLRLRRRVLGDEHRDTLISVNNLAALLQDQGKLTGAEVLFREALEGARRVLGNRHPLTLSAINNLGNLLQAQGKLFEAERFLRESLDVSRFVLGDEHPDTLISMNNLGGLLQVQGKPSQAEPFLREALEASRRVQGNEHPDTLISLSNLGSLLQSQGKLIEAESLFREALDASRRILGEEHPYALALMNNLGVLLQIQDKFPEAESLFRAALEVRIRLLGSEHLATLNSMNNLGFLLQAQGKLAAAEPLIRAALEGSRRALGDAHPDTLNSMENLEALLRTLLLAARQAGDELQEGEALARLGSFLVSLERFAEAEELLGESLEFLFAELPESDARPWQAQFNLARAIAGQVRFGEAQSILEESAQWLLGHGEALAAVEPSATPETIGEVLQALVHFEAAWQAAQPTEGRAGKAASWQTKLNAWNAKHKAVKSK